MHLIDIPLPDINGLDFQVRLAPVGIRLPVVIITGHGDIPMPVRGMKRGAMEFLSKPFHDQDTPDAFWAPLNAIETGGWSRVMFRRRVGSLKRSLPASCK
jgi:FixJ family two-component response regulator